MRIIKQEDFYGLCGKLLSHIHLQHRGGISSIIVIKNALPLGNFISKSLSLPIFTIEVFYYNPERNTDILAIGSIKQKFNYGNNILLIDNVYRTGETINAIERKIKKEINPGYITTSVLLWNNLADNQPDYYVEEFNGIKNEWIDFA